MPVAVRSKLLLCGRSIFGIAASNPAEGMDISSVVCCVGSGLCDQLIIRSEESHRLWVIFEPLQ